MGPFLEKLRLAGWLSLLLGAGFLATDLVSYRAAGDSLRRTFAVSAVPAVSDLVHGEIQADIRRQAVTAGAAPAIHRIADGRGGAADAGGTALPAEVLSSLVEKYQSRFGCRIHFVDSAGIIVLGTDAMRHVRELPGLRRVAADILSASARPTQSNYRDGETTVLVNTRFIPELEWYLVVEQSDEAGIGQLQRAFLLNLAIGAAVAGLVLTSVLAMVNRYRKRLANAAAVDPLTGLINRSAYEFVFRQTLLETDRTREPLSLILCEVDLFKRLVAAGGRGRGEVVLRNMAELARKSVRATDPVARWSEDLFVIQLRNCPLENALDVAERLRQSVAAHDFGLDSERLAVTASLGVAMHEHQEAERDFLKRVQEALGQAKAQGGNRVEPEFAAPC